MNEEKLAEIKAYCAATTQEKWIDDPSVDGRVIIHDGLTACICVCYYGHLTKSEQKHNATFIANAHHDLPAAVEEIGRLRAEAVVLREQVKNVDDAIDAAYQAGKSEGLSPAG